MVDYVKLTATAQRLITENGRSATLVEYDDTLQDAAKPWQGAADPRAVPASTLTIFAAFVDPSSGLGLDFVPQDLLKDAESVAICSPGAQVDPSIFHELIDGTTRWKLTGVSVLRPADVTVLAVLGLKR